MPRRRRRALAYARAIARRYRTRCSCTTLAALLVGAVLLSLTPPASAIVSEQKFTAAASSNIAGTKARPKPIALKVRLWFDDIAPDLDRQVQFALVRASVYFPADGVTNNKLFPGCEPATILVDDRQCPAASRVGTGSGRGIGLGLDEQITVRIFNAPAGKGVTLLIVGDSPLIIREVVEAKLTTLTGDPKFKYRLDFTVPKNLQSPAPGVIAAVKDLTLTVPLQYLKKNGRFVLKKKKRIPYIATTGCATGKWSGRYIAEYTTTFDSAIESTQTVDIDLPCKKGKGPKK